jgi:hypothetical protein
MDVMTGSSSFLRSAKNVFADLVLTVLSCRVFERVIGADLLRVWIELGRDAASGGIGEIRSVEYSDVVGFASAFTNGVVPRGFLWVILRLAFWRNKEIQRIIMYVLVKISHHELRLAMTRDR